MLRKVYHLMLLNQEETQFKLIFIDADHAGNKMTRRSHTGILLFMNIAPIYCYSRRQNTLEPSTFSRKFVALKTAVELVISM